MTMIEELERLAALRSGNMLTQDEFEVAKSRVLAGDKRAMRRRLGNFARGTTPRASWSEVFVIPLVFAAAVLFACALYSGATRPDSDPDSRISLSDR